MLISKIEGNEQRFPIYFLLPHMHSIPYYQHPHQSSTFVTMIDLCFHVTESPQVTLGFMLGVVHSMGLQKCIMTCIRPQVTVQNILIYLKIPYVHPSFLLTLATTDILLSSQFCLFKMSQDLDHTVCMQPFQMAYFTW